jgi:hypothetical protein
MAPLARAFAELPQAAERKQLGMQNRNPDSDACDIDARLAQAQGEGFDKFGRIGELAGLVRSQPMMGWLSLAAIACASVPRATVVNALAFL